MLHASSSGEIFQPHLELRERTPLLLLVEGGGAMAAIELPSSDRA